jgi:hypothetical protein
VVSVIIQQDVIAYVRRSRSTRAETENKNRTARSEFCDAVLQFGQSEYRPRQRKQKNKGSEQAQQSIAQHGIIL